jgi:hypothetical protein
MIMRSISARYDDGRVLFDEDIVIPSHARLLVTILEDTDSERSDFLALSATTLADAYDTDEIEYFEGDVRK